jgi:asparagine synthase (glutamine-hydrolysing)
MCGICGIFPLDREQIIDRRLLEEMNFRLRHRGLDGEGFFSEPGISMAMRRLAIIDIAGGNQPISNEDGTIIIVFNGEIYNFQELGNELGKLGHQFKTRSDTEVIVHAYEQWGDDALLRFKGMFAFSLWDSRLDRLLIARDRMGEKPLYWHFSKEGLSWASEAKALLALPWVERKINMVALHHYFTLQYTPDPLTIYQDIYRLPAAHKLVLERGKSPAISRWWQLRFEPKWEITEAEAIEQSCILLRQAVERQMISEVPLGAFLSGGIDSSVIVALMAEHSTQPVKTFSIGFVERQYTEAKYARQIAKRYSTDHHEFIFRPADLIRLIEKVIAAVDEPFADPAALPLFELARQARTHVTVALSGDGGDETLAGYRRYSLDGLLQPYANLPAWITQRAVPAAFSLLPEPSWIPEDRNPIAGLKRLAQFSEVTSKASLVRWGSYFNHKEKLELYSDNLREELSDVDTSNWISQAYDEASAMSHLDRTLSAEHATYLSGDLLPKTDRMTMAHSLEARAPFLDADWVEWTARLPMRYKIRGMKNKWLLRTAFQDKLPSAIFTRGKQGFAVPLGLWLQSELQEWSKSLIIENPILTELFSPSAILRLYTEHQQGRINHGKKIWSLLMFALWSQ